MTTKRLLEVTQYASIFFLINFYIFLVFNLRVTFKNNRVLADATYKIFIEGFPRYTIGATDECLMFHPFGFAIVLHMYQLKTESSSLTENERSVSTAGLFLLVM